MATDDFTLLDAQQGLARWGGRIEEHEDGHAVYLTHLYDEFRRKFETQAEAVDFAGWLLRSLRMTLKNDTGHPFDSGTLHLISCMDLNYDKMVVEDDNEEYPWRYQWRVWDRHGNDRLWSSAVRYVTKERATTGLAEFAQIWANAMDKIPDRLIRRWERWLFKSQLVEPPRA